MVECQQETHGVDDGVDGADLVEVHLVYGIGAVSASLGAGQRGERGSRQGRHARRDVEGGGRREHPRYLGQVTQLSQPL